MVRSASSFKCGSRWTCQNGQASKGRTGKHFGKKLLYRLFGDAGHMLAFQPDWSALKCTLQGGLVGIQILIVVPTISATYGACCCNFVCWVIPVTGLSFYFATNPNFLPYSVLCLRYAANQTEFYAYWYCSLECLCRYWQYIFMLTANAYGQDKLGNIWPSLFWKLLLIWFSESVQLSLLCIPRSMSSQRRGQKTDGMFQPAGGLEVELSFWYGRHSIYPAMVFPFQRRHTCLHIISQNWISTGSWKNRH